MSFWKFSAKPRIRSVCSPTWGNASRYDDTKCKSISKCQKKDSKCHFLAMLRGITIHWLMNIPGNLLFATQQVYKGFPDLFCAIYILYERVSGGWQLDNAGDRSPGHVTWILTCDWLILGTHWDMTYLDTTLDTLYESSGPGSGVNWALMAPLFSRNEEADKSFHTHSFHYGFVVTF